MISLRRATELGSHNSGIVDAVDSATALAFFNASSQLAPSPLQVAAAQQGAFGQIPPAPFPNQMSRPMLKRRRSSRLNTSQNEKSIEAPRQPSQGSDVDDNSGEQKRTKLGYHRTSIACGHCRRRKIRCLISTDEKSNKCSNCIRLKKECSFHPVDQSVPNSKSKQKAAKGNAGQKRNIAALSPTSTVPPPKRVLSEGSLKKFPRMIASTRPEFMATQNRNVLSPNLSGSTQDVDQFPNLYSSQLRQNWLPSAFHHPRSLSDQGQQRQVDFNSTANAPTSIGWDSTVAQRSSQSAQQSPQWQAAMAGSPQPTFTPPNPKFSSWGRPHRSVSHPLLGSEKSSYTAQGSPFITPMMDVSQLGFQQLLDNETLLQASTAAEAANVSLQTTLPESDLLTMPAMTMSQEPSSFLAQQSWPMFEGQHDIADQTGQIEDSSFNNQWYQMN